MSATRFISKRLQIGFFALLLFIIAASLLSAALTSEQVVQVQQKLTELGYATGRADGIMGPITEKALKQFQTHQKLPVTGRVDENTLTALGLSESMGAVSGKTGGERRTTADNFPSAETSSQRQTARGLLLSIPFHWYFFSGLVLTLLAFVGVRRLGGVGRKKSWGYFFAKNSLEFLVPFVAVSGFYFLLAYSLSYFSNYLSLKRLVAFENVVTQVKSVVDHLNFEPLTVLLIFVLLFILGLLRVPPQGFETASSAFSRYQKITRRLYITIVLMCSLTLLGTYAGEPTNDLRIRIKTLRDGYADLVSDIESSLVEETATEILKSAKAQLPETYTNALALSLTEEDKLYELAAYYRTEQKKWHIDLPGVNAMIDSRIPKPKVIVFEAAGGSVADSSMSRRLQTRVPAAATIQNLEKLRAQIEKTPARAGKRRLVELVGSKSGRKILCEIPRVFTHRVRNGIVRQCAARYPLLEPIVDIFVNTFDDKMQQKIENAAVRIADSGLKQPENSRQMIKEEVGKLAAPSKLSVDPGRISKAEALGLRLQSDLQAYDAAKERIEAKVKSVQSKEVRGLISQLTAPDPETRADAARRLAQMGKTISRGDFDKIVDIMRNGRAESRKKLYRQSHCTWYEYTQSRYYAAEALMTINSPYINEQIIGEARRAKAEGRAKRRVNDPGWV
jgi:hypothetical protein